MTDRRTHDEVDDIVAAWHRERPDLPVEPLQVLSRVSRLAQRVDNERAAAFERHDVAAWEFDVLAALRRSGAPYTLTPGELSAATYVTTGTMTNRINRLKERGLVTRTSHPSDGRAALVALTDAGRQRVDEALQDLLAVEADLLAGLSAADRERLSGLLRTLMLALPGESDAN